MRQVNGLSASPKARKWLEQLTWARILNIFPDAINLIDEGSHLLSVVNIKVGNGPFSLVVNKSDFSKLVSITDQISKERAALIIGETAFSFDGIHIWDPVPNWDAVLAIDKIGLIEKIDQKLGGAKPPNGFVEVFYPTVGDDKSIFFDPMENGSSLLLTGIANHDTEKIITGAESLSGLGVGLTPSGDDFLMGVLYGLWATDSHQNAISTAELVFAGAAGQTTSLSREWLAAAVNGEAGDRWHALINATIEGREEMISEAVEDIIATGATSGADALCGFVQVLKIKDLA